MDKNKNKKNTKTITIEVVDRKILRNQMKKVAKSNRISKGWRKYQTDKYGVRKWFDMFLTCNTNKKARVKKVGV